MPTERLQRFTQANHQGAVAEIAPIPFADFEESVERIIANAKIAPLILLLDGLTDVRNFGAIARTALACGAHGLVVGLRDAAPANSEAVKASAGALLQIPVCREISIVNAIEQLQQHGLRILGLSADAESMPWQEDFRVPVAVVAGAEGAGLHPDVRNALDNNMRLPMPGNFDSYNVSVALGMIAYEAAKQRGS